MCDWIKIVRENELKCVLMNRRRGGRNTAPRTNSYSYAVQWRNRNFLTDAGPVRIRLNADVRSEGEKKKLLYINFIHFSRKYKSASIIKYIIVYSFSFSKSYPIEFVSCYKRI